MNITKFRIKDNNLIHKIMKIKHSITNEVKINSIRSNLRIKEIKAIYRYNNLTRIFINQISTKMNRIIKIKNTIPTNNSNIMQRIKIIMKKYIPKQINQISIINYLSKND
jgi:hypothetical protein